MKKVIRIITGICAFLLVFSCKEESVAPQIEASINKELLAINETMIISFSGSTADQIVVFTGDDMHEYELRDQSNTGLVVNKNLFTYAYGEPGVYKVVCVASTAGEMATNLQYDICSFTVTVIDDVTEIDRLSCSQVIRDEIFGNRYPNDEWLMALPRKVIYNNREQNIALTSQRLRFYIQSDSTKVLVNGSEYLSTKGYNLSVPVDILVKSDFGTNRPYTLYTAYYPEFSSFKLAGVEGTLNRNIFDYTTFVMNITLPSGTNVSNLVPEFTTYSAAEKVYIGSIEQISGASAVDFTKEVTYRLVSTLPENPTMKVEVDVVVKITFQ